MAGLGFRQNPSFISLARMCLSPTGQISGRCMKYASSLRPRLRIEKQCFCHSLLDTARHMDSRNSKDKEINFSYLAGAMHVSEVYLEGKVENCCSFHNLSQL